MMVVSLQRKKCIGCNYCMEFAPEQFRMSKKDGKSVLIGSQNKNGFHTIKMQNDIYLQQVEIAKLACPVKIIQVSHKK